MTLKSSKVSTVPKVLHVIGAMDRGGAESLIMNIYRSIDRSQLCFDFLVHETRECDFDNEIRTLGGNIYSIDRFNGVNIRSYQKQLAHFFREHNNYHAVHVHIGSSAALVIREAHKYGLFCIAHSHNTNPELSILEIGFRFFSYPTRYLADYFFACSEEAGRDRFGSRVASGDRFKVINNGIELQKYTYSRSARKAIRNELGLLPDQRAICHIGRFSTEKNHDFLIQVFASYLHYRPNSVLFLIGRGPLLEQTKQRVKELNISDRVIFMGVRDDVPLLLNAMDLFLFPSKWEGLGIAAIEAQASGLPCILSPKLPEMALCCPYVISAGSITNVDEWVHLILQADFRSDADRVDGCHYVRDAGFDILNTASYLSAFYLGHRKG